MRLHEPEQPDKTPGSAASADPYGWLEEEQNPRVRDFVATCTLSPVATAW